MIRRLNSMRPTRVLLMCAMCAPWACTDASLYGKVGQEPQIANKVALTGVLCTDNPATRQFPVKIMFIVDVSSGMKEAAPNGEYVDAIQATLDAFLGLPNHYVSIISYDSHAVSQITEMAGTVASAFTRDPVKANNAVSIIRNAMSTGNRNFPAAFSLARSLLTGDAFQADKGPLSRTKYVVIHITSGSPEPPILPTECDGVFATPPANCELSLLEKEVTDLRDQMLSLGAAEFAWDIAYVEEPRVEGAPCDPTRGNVQCTAVPGLTCVPAGHAKTSGRCVQLCDPAAPICTAFANQPVCVATDLPDGTSINYCATHKSNCFDGKDDAKDGKALDCSSPMYPYNCTAMTPGGCEPACRSACRSEQLGLGITLAAGGKYQRFSWPDDIDFVGLFDIRSTQRTFVLKEFFAYNRNAVLHRDQLLVDTDGDGLTDDEEASICETVTSSVTGMPKMACLDPLNPDTDGDNFNDKLEHEFRTLGFDPLKTTTIADCLDPTIDSDGDGLKDCEEQVLGSDKTLFDTDADGFPDKVEFNVGTNPLANDTLDDIDLDGVGNGNEIKAHTDVLSNDAMSRSELAYRVQIKDLGPTSDDRICYDIRVTNITLVNPLDRGFGTGVNDIDVFFGQVPEGRIDAYGVFHVAQIRVQYFPPNRRDPDTPALDLQDGDFTTFEQ